MSPDHSSWTSLGAGHHVDTAGSAEPGVPTGAVPGADYTSRGGRVRQAGGLGLGRESELPLGVELGK